MASKSLFRSYLGRLLPAADTRNEAGGAAYRLEARQALAQYASTGCLNSVFYAAAEMQLEEVLALCEAVEPEFIARTAIYARRNGFMKDLPALLAVVLSVRAPELLPPVFEAVIDSPRMLRNFVQILRSGVVGRKSLGSLPKRLVRQWLARRTDEQLFRGSIGQDPSLADVVKMVHPKPATPEREALLGYLLDRPHDADRLPEVVRQFETYKVASDRRDLETPDVPFQMLTALDLAPWEWRCIARHASWQMTRMNLNTFLRHGVFDDRELVRLVAERLRDPVQVARARVFPYQLLAAYQAASVQLPGEIRAALQDALDVALAGVPVVKGKVFVFPDISGSMHSPVTGHRKGATSAVRCVDVAALVAAALVRTNPSTEVVPFEARAVEIVLNPRDSVLTNAARLAALPCGGTDCSAPLRHLNERGRTGDLVVYVSDMESWIDSPQHGHWGGSPTATLAEWARFKARSPQARMVCIDLQPYGTTQAQERADVFNVAGFSDQVFDLLAAVAEGTAGADHWVRQIEAVPIEAGASSES